MIRSMYSAVSALRNHQQAMDVVGNNLANVNTTGFKTGRAVFADSLYQNLTGAQAPGGGAAGGIGIINPSQIGLGMRLTGVDTFQTQGNLQFTGRNTDLAIQGNGFFILSDGVQTPQVQGLDYPTRFYSRDGAFDIDATGALVNPTTGHKVLGMMNTAAFGAAPAYGAQLAPIVIPQNQFTSFTISNTGQVLGIAAAGNTLAGSPPAGAQVVVGKLQLATFANPSGMLRVGKNEFVPTVASGTVTPAIPAPATPANNPGVSDATLAGAGEIVTGALEMSNVDVADQMSKMIITQRGFQANSRLISVSDEMLQELMNLKR